MSGLWRIHLILVILFCVILIGSAVNLVHALGFSSQGQEEYRGQDVSLGQGQVRGGGNFAGGRQGDFGQPGAFGGGAGGTRSGFAGASNGGQPAGEDARQYNFRIYTEPEYYGYESKFPGGKAMFRSFRSAQSGFGRQGGLGGQGEYSDGFRSARPNENFGSVGGRGAILNENFGPLGLLGPQY